jgi:hypothetical protein
VIVGKRTESHWDKDGRGNYWSSYDGYDLDGDGVGDVPMKIQNVFHYLEGVNSNVRLYLYSPASQALALAVQAFPIININEEADTHPLMMSHDMKTTPAMQAVAAVDRNAHNGSRSGSAPWVAAPILGTAALGFLYHRLSRRAAE